MAAPPLYLLQRLRALRGDAFVTYPHGSLDYKQVERTYNVPRGQTPDDFLATDGEYTGTKLVEQHITGGDAQYVEIYQKYKTLPGPLIGKAGFNKEYGASVTEYWQEVALPQAPYTPGAILSGQIIIDSYVTPVNDSVVMGTLYTYAMSLPPSRTEYESIGWESPSIFEFLSGWLIPNAPFVLTGPFPGVNFTKSAHKTASQPAAVLITYTNGAPLSSVPTVYVVDTPGQADRFFSIGANTIHNAITMVQFAGLSTETVESLPASTPTSYTPGATLTIRASQRKVFGPLYERRVTSITAP